MRISAPRLLATALTAGLLLSGCGGSPEPSPLPKPSTSASPSAAATPTPPVMPAAAKAKTKAGAIAFTQTYIKTLNYSGATGETTPLRKLFIPPCTRCEATADGIDETYSSGGHFSGGEWTPTRFKFYAIDNNVAVLDAFVDYADQTWVKSAGASPTVFRASRGNLKAFNLRWQDGTWFVSALDPDA